MNSEEGQNDIAKAIADAIISYKREYFGADDTDFPGNLKTNEIPVKQPSAEELAQAEAQRQANLIHYKVQLSTTKKKMDLVPNNFKGLNTITMTSDGKMNKYMYGETTNYDEAKKLLEEAKSKGYDSAILIAFKNGELINIQDAIK